MTKYKTQLNNDILVNLFIVACEGGSNYWCKSIKPKYKTKDRYESMLDGFGVVPLEDEIKTIQVSKNDIAEAVSLLWVKTPHVLKAIIDDSYDAGDADCFFQLCVFKEVIYG